MSTNLGPDDPDPSPNINDHVANSASLAYMESVGAELNPEYLEVYEALARSKRV